jgi:hypothetical protein
MFNIKKNRKLEKENLELKIDIERERTYIDYLKHEIKIIADKEIDLNNLDVILSKKVYCENCKYYSYTFLLFPPYFYYCTSPFNKFINKDFKREKNIFSERPDDLNKYNNCNMYIIKEK